jgi:pimeloyl-ACP methyl ester carboxylesterase
MSSRKLLDRELKTIELKDGRFIGYAEYGDPHGIPIFYFHGFPGSRLEAGCFHEVAVANHYRLIGLDRPGMGMSSINPKGSILSWATDVANFADCLGIEKFSIIGHSGGAAFVAACAYVIPQRLNKVIIVSGMAPLDNPESKIGMAHGQRVANKLIQTMPWLTSLMMKITRKVLKNSNKKMMEQMLKQLPEVDQAIFRDPVYGPVLINNTLEAFRQGIAGPAQEMKLLFNPWQFNLENITCQVIIWQGALDTQAPISHAKIYANLIPGAQLNIIENEGHHSLLKNHIDKILDDIKLD